MLVLPPPEVPEILSQRYGPSFKTFASQGKENDSRLKDDRKNVTGGKKERRMSRRNRSRRSRRDRKCVTVRGWMTAEVSRSDKEIRRGRATYEEYFFLQF